MKPPRENTLSQQIPVGSVLGGRYEITAHIIITAESDMVLEGTDQILNRKVSVVVASPSRSALLEANSRALATNARGNIQILDLGITPEVAATSSPPTPAPTPCWTPCWSKTTHSPTQKTRWAPKSSATPKAAAPPTPTRRSPPPPPTRRASPPPRTGTHPTAPPHRVLRTHQHLRR